MVERGEIESPLSDFQSDVRTSYTTAPYRKNFIVHEILFFLLLNHTQTSLQLLHHLEGHGFYSSLIFRPYDKSQYARYVTKHEIARSSKSP